MLPYDDGRLHIRLMVVNEEYRKHGLGTKMLTYVAGKYRNRTVTLNVTFDRIGLAKLLLRQRIREVRGVLNQAQSNSVFSRASEAIGNDAIPWMNTLKGTI